LALDLVGPLVVEELDNYFLAGNSFAALVDSAHFDYYSMKNWDGSATLHCKCGSMGCCDYSSPHNLLALDL
jgi:hypothetical protein